MPVFNRGQGTQVMPVTINLPIQAQPQTVNVPSPVQQPQQGQPSRPLVGGEVNSVAAAPSPPSASRRSIVVPTVV